MGWAINFDFWGGGSHFHHHEKVGQTLKVMPPSQLIRMFEKTQQSIFYCYWL